MGNLFTKEMLRCKKCEEENIEPKYFTRRPNSILIGTMDEPQYDKYGKEIPDQIENKLPKFIYKCSNGHEVK